MNHRLTPQYDGTNFHGWQVQGADCRTVQGELQCALSVLEGNAVVAHGAGRTDVGVPRVALATLDVPALDPSACPLCAQGVPAIKPGSKKITAASDELETVITRRRYLHCCDSRFFVKSC